MKHLAISVGILALIIVLSYFIIQDMLADYAKQETCVISPSNINITNYLPITLLLCIVGALYWFFLAPK